MLLIAIHMLFLLHFFSYEFSWIFESSLMFGLFKNAIKALESQTELVKDQIEKEKPEFMKLEKSFHDRREAFEQTKKDLVGEYMH